MLLSRCLMKKTKCLISDLGGVLLFFDNSLFFDRLAERCPFSAEEIRGMVVHTEKLLADFDTNRVSASEFHRKAVGILRADLGQEDFFKFYNDVFWPNPPVLELYARLASEFRLILLSNTDVERFGFIRRTFPEIFIFDDYVLSYEVGVSKPRAEIYLETLKRAELRPEDCVFVDDLEKNTAGAESLGIASILYSAEIDLEAELQKRGFRAKS
jgi:FMN phosphatase YigB (HAD superfamily)